MDYTFVGLVVACALVLVTAGVLTGRREAERRQLRQLAVLERKLDAVLHQLGVEVPDPHLEQVKALAGRGRTIQAVKAYREATGAGLREAKEAVDRIGGRG